MKKTKRRKVWVNDRGGHLGTVSETRREALLMSTVAVPFVEIRRGDVVLSENQVDALDALLHALEHLVGPNLELRANDEVDWESVSNAKKAVKLLRGGR